MIPFPNKKYSIIYADPPWDVKRGPDWGSGKISNPLPYPTMSITDIKSLPVQNITNKDAHLYLWTINKYIYINLMKLLKVGDLIYHVC